MLGLPIPHFTAITPEEQLAQVQDYLFQLIEELEFALNNLSADNLSQELLDRLNSLGAGIEDTKNESEEKLQQVTNKTITVSDVINLNAFESAVSNMMPSFTVNYETGNLEYK